MALLDRWRDTPYQQQSTAVLQTFSAHRLTKRLGKIDDDTLEGVIDTALSEFQQTLRIWRTQQSPNTKVSALHQAQEQAETLLEAARELQRRFDAHYPVR